MELDIITIKTLDLKLKDFPLKEFNRNVVKKWLGVSGIKFFKEGDDDNEIIQFNSGDVLFAIPFISDPVLNKLLIETSSDDNVSEVIELVKKNTDVDTKDDLMRTPLHLACENKNYAIAECLIEHDADVNAVQINNWTPLHFACHEGDYLMVQLLIRKGADLLIVNVDEFTPLHIAIYMKHDIITNFLLGILLHKARANQSSIKM